MLRCYSLHQSMPCPDLHNLIKNNLIQFPERMGNTKSKSKGQGQGQGQGSIPTAVSESAAVSTMASTSSSTDMQEFTLMKRRPGCTGMFWRSDPTGTTRLESNNHWPRDGAKLKGRVVTTVQGKKWLLATHVQQKGSAQWHPAPKGAAMPFEYNSHYYLKASQK